MILNFLKDRYLDYSQIMFDTSEDQGLVWDGRVDVEGFAAYLMDYFHETNDELEKQIESEMFPNGIKIREQKQIMGLVKMAGFKLYRQRDLKAKTKKSA